MHGVNFNKVAVHGDIPNPAVGDITLYRLIRIPRWMQKNSDGVVTCCGNLELRKVRKERKALRAA